MAEKLRMTRLELLDVRDKAWRNRLRSASLAAETFDDLRPGNREQALECLAQQYRAAASEARRFTILRRWPAVHVITTTGVAADHYEKGTFWPYLSNAVGVRNEQALHNEWGECFLENLAELGLPTFAHLQAEAGTRYVGRILLHTGMPTYCLGDFFQIVTERRAIVPGLTPEAFLDWAAKRAMRSGLATVDVPVRRFLHFGQEFALDLIDRTFDLLDTLAAHGDADLVPLPDRFRVAATNFVRAQSTLPAARRASSGAALLHPRIVLDPFGQGVMLQLPPVGDVPDGSAVWLVEVDGDLRTIMTKALWPGSDEPAPATQVPITRPARSVTVSLESRPDLSVTLRLVDDQSPLLVFNEDGELLSPGLPIPAALTWALFPSELGEGGLTVSGRYELRSESPLPPGWSGWSLQLLEIAHASAITAGGTARTVRGQAAARVDVGVPVPGVRTTLGQPVVSSRPVVTLPADVDRRAWSIELLDGAKQTISRWDAASDLDPESVWNSVPSPVCGSFMLRIRGPWGRGASRSFNLVEGLDVAAKPGWRAFSDIALQPCTVTVKAATDVVISRATVQLGPRDRDTIIRVGAHGDFQSVIISPPHMSVVHQSRTMTGTPSIRPVRLFQSDLLDDPGTLMVDLGSPGDPHLYVHGPAGIVQELAPGRGTHGIYHFDLSRITDTVRTNPQLTLSLSPTLRLVVATIRPRRLFGTIELHDDVLYFSDCLPLEGLTALVYAQRAPWRLPAVIPVTDGEAALPGWLQSAGPMRVLVRLEDPWAPEPVPAWPPGAESSQVMNTGHLTDDLDPEAVVLSAYLAGEGAFPEFITDHSRLWTVRGLLGDLSLGDRSNDVCVDLDRAISRSPRAALTALNATTTAEREIPKLLIRTGLAASNLAAAHDVEPLVWSARNALPSALLSAADAEWSEDEVDAAISVCGDVVVDLLAGNDPYVRTGLLDRSADVFDQNPSRREQFVREASLVPQGLLSGEARILAAIELVENRRDHHLTWLNHHVRDMLRDTRLIVGKLPVPPGQVAFEIRAETALQDWHSLPALSLGFALAARCAARGNVLAQNWLQRSGRPWADLGAVVPKLVTIDIIIAEFLVAGCSARRGGTGMKRVDEE